MKTATEEDAREAAKAIGLELYKRSQNPIMRQVMGNRFALIAPSNVAFHQVIKLDLTAQEVIDFCYNQHAPRKVGQKL